MEVYIKVRRSSPETSRTSATSWSLCELIDWTSFQVHRLGFEAKHRAGAHQKFNSTSTSSLSEADNHLSSQYCNYGGWYLTFDCPALNSHLHFAGISDVSPLLPSANSGGIWMWGSQGCGHLEWAAANDIRILLRLLRPGSFGGTMHENTPWRYSVRIIDDT